MDHFLFSFFLRPLPFHSSLLSRLQGGSSTWRYRQRSSRSAWHGGRRHVLQDPARRSCWTGWQTGRGYVQTQHPGGKRTKKRCYLAAHTLFFVFCFFQLSPVLARSSPLSSEVGTSTVRLCMPGTTRANIMFTCASSSSSSHRLDAIALLARVASTQRPLQLSVTMTVMGPEDNWSRATSGSRCLTSHKNEHIRSLTRPKAQLLLGFLWAVEGVLVRAWLLKIPAPASSLWAHEQVPPPSPQDKRKRCHGESECNWQ